MWFKKKRDKYEEVLDIIHEMIAYNERVIESFNATLYKSDITDRFVKIHRERNQELKLLLNLIDIRIRTR